MPDKEFHPVAEIFPLMSETEFRNLCDDIRENGLREDIWTHEDRIIDGRNRYNACLAAQVEPRFREWPGKGDLIAFVVSLNLHRRHLSESQRALVAARIATLQQGEKKDNAQNCALSQSDAAEMLNISRRSVQHAAKVLRDGVSDLQEMVESGELSVAAASTIAAQPKGKQKRLIRKEKSKIVSYASKIRVEKTLKKARTTHDICLICNPVPKEEITQERFVAMLQVLSRKMPGNYARYINSAIEEIEELEVADDIRTDYDQILEAIDAGFQTEADIARHTGLARDVLRYELSCLEDYGRIEPVPQGGKTQMARGARKKLWQRKQIKSGPDKNIDGDYRDEFLPSADFTGNRRSQSFELGQGLGKPN